MTDPTEIMNIWKLEVADEFISNRVEMAEKMAELTPRVVDFVVKMHRLYSSPLVPSTPMSKVQPKAEVRAINASPSADSGFPSLNHPDSSRWPKSQVEEEAVTSKSIPQKAQAPLDPAHEHLFVINGLWPAFYRWEVRIAWYKEDEPQWLQQRLEEDGVLNNRLKTIIITSNVGYGLTNPRTMQQIPALIEFMHRAAPSARIKFLALFAKTPTFAHFNFRLAQQCEPYPYVDYVDMNKIFGKEETRKRHLQHRLYTSFFNGVIDTILVDCEVDFGREFNRRRQESTGNCEEVNWKAPTVATPHERPISSKDSRFLYVVCGVWPELDAQDLRVIRYKEASANEVYESLNAKTLLRGDLQRVYLSCNVEWLQDAYAAIAGISSILQLIQYRCPLATTCIHGFYTLEIGQKGREFNRKLKEHSLIHRHLKFVDLDELKGSDEYFQVAEKLPNTNGVDKYQHVTKILMQMMIEKMR